MRRWLALLLFVGACRSLSAEELNAAALSGPSFGDFLGVTKRSRPNRRGALRQNRHWVSLGLIAAAALLQINDLDEKWTLRFTDGNPLPGSEENTVSDVLSHGLVGTAIVAPLVVPPYPERRYPRQNYFYTNSYAIVLNTGLQALVKTFDLRYRPDGTGSSFYSGHSSNSFAAATLLDREYGPAAGAPAYVLASATALYRVDARQHWFSDVLVGAGVGIFMGNLIYEKNHGPNGLWAYPRTTLVPILSKDKLGLTLTIRW